MKTEVKANGPTVTVRLRDESNQQARLRGGEHTEALNFGQELGQEFKGAVGEMLEVTRRPPIRDRSVAFEARSCEPKLLRGKSGQHASSSPMQR